MKLICGFLAVLLAVYSSVAVDKNNFKSCDQSGFCKRLRAFKPERSPFVLNRDTVIVHGNVLSAEVNSVSVEDEKKTVLVRAKKIDTSFVLVSLFRGIYTGQFRISWCFYVDSASSVWFNIVIDPSKDTNTKGHIKDMLCSSRFLFP